MMAKCVPSYGKYMECCMKYRSDVVPKKLQKSSCCFKKGYENVGVESSDEGEKVIKKKWDDEEG